MQVNIAAVAHDKAECGESAAAGPKAIPARGRALHLHMLPSRGGIHLQCGVKVGDMPVSFAEISFKTFFSM